MSDFYISSSGKKGGSKKKPSCDTSPGFNIQPSSSSNVCNCSGGGSVTSIGLYLPTDVFSITGSPITSSGIITALFNTQVANTVFSGPSSGANAVPTFRVLVPADIPVLSSLNGSLSLTQLAQGGASLNQALLWNGSNWTPSTISGSVPGGVGAGQMLYWTGSAWAVTSPRKNVQLVTSGNTVTLPDIPNASLVTDVYLNGILKEAGVDYSLVSNTITFLTYSFIANDKITTKYYT